ncbi:MAG: 50S ribosomal protein L17 [Bacteroidetes bacterium]|nr:MAG: 50S ribosomal protein L17 [Bacteroidota bacterium]
MRHRKKINHLGRKTQHRSAMLSNMASSLILKKRIFTTVAKAKALRVYVEPLITKSKEDSTHSRRTVFAYLQNKHAVSELFREVSQKVAERPGGYTRILKTGFRQGDAAEMCFIELVDYNTNMLKTDEDPAKRTRRSRRGKKSSDTAPEVAAPKTEEKPVDEVTDAAEETPEVEAAVESPAEVEETTETTEKAEQEEVKDEKPKNAKEEPEAKKGEPEAKSEAQHEAVKEEKKEEPKAEKEEPKAEKEEPKAEAKEAKVEKKEEQADKKETKPEADKKTEAEETDKEPKAEKKEKSGSEKSDDNPDETSEKK